MVWQEKKKNEWVEVISYCEHQGSVNRVEWAPWECGLILAAASSDGAVSILRRTRTHFQFHFRHNHPSLHHLAKDEWDKPYIFKAHEQGVNSISWAPLIGLKDYAVG